MKLYLSAAICGVFMACITIPVSTMAGPFGLEQGLTRDQLDLGEDYKQGEFLKLKSVPIPYKDFEKYYIKTTDKSGVCSIMSQSPYNTWDPNGNKSQHVFDELEETLDTIYGKNIKKDMRYVDPSSGLTGRSDFIKSINKKVRSHRIEWDNRGKEITNGVKKVTLIIFADSDDSSRVILFYKFMNDSDCDNYIDPIKASKAKESSL